MLDKNAAGVDNVLERRPQYDSHPAVLETRGASGSGGVSCDGCEFCKPGRHGDTICDCSGAQVWPHKHAAAHLPKGLSEAIGNRQDGARPVRRYGIDMDGKRCPRTLTVNGYLTMKPAQIGGVLRKTSERGHLIALLDRYNEADRGKLVECLNADLARTDKQVKHNEHNRESRERLTAAQRGHTRRVT